MDPKSTLRAIFDNGHNVDRTAIIIPRSCPVPSTLSYNQLYKVIEDFSAKLRSIVPNSQLAPGNSISIAYPNSLEFVVSFLACGFMKLIASPLNPAYTKEEFLFYLEDAKSTVMIVPPGSIKSNYAAVLAAEQRRNIYVVEVYWNGKTIVINTTQSQGLSNVQTVVFNPQPEDIALLLHTRWKLTTIIVSTLDAKVIETFFC